jgi:tRNA uridine 5-carbamoylmethylation protein Kti12
MPAPTTLLDLSILPTYSCLNTYMYIIWTLNYVAGLPVKRHHEVKSKVKSWCLAKKERSWERSGEELRRSGECLG